ncbi:MAG: two-component regulator propeller domain-containing protein [Thermoanaerobaculia bacterium]|jgi:signal transduction histidine kinase/ligand-binding sensor domain-containing protein/DNA-binding response OmpR family regulator
MGNRARRGGRITRKLSRVRASFAFAALIFGAFISSSSSAQQLPAINYGADEGLSHSQVWSMFQDSRGYLWVGTSDGLNRFDAVSFSVFRTRDGLRNPTIRTIAEDGSGKLWFGTDDGVSTFDGRRFTSFSTADGLGKGIVWGSATDKFGRLWFATQYGGVSLLEKGRFRSFSTKEGLGSEYGYSLLSDSKGYLWIGHRGAGVTRCVPDREKGLSECRRFTKADGLAHDDVHAITETRDGAILFGTRGGGISKWDGSRFTTYTKANGIADDDVYALLVNVRGDLVVGTVNAGLSICDASFSSCHSYSTANGLPDSSVLGLYEGRDHALWVGFQGGLTRIASDRMASYSLGSGLPNRTVYAIEPDKDGTVWIGTLGGLVRVRNGPAPGAAARIDTWIDEFPSKQIWDLHRDARGRLWVASQTGLCLFEATRGCVDVIDKNDGLASSELISLAETRDGALLVTGTEGLSILRYEGKGIKPKIRNYTVKEGLAGSYAIAIAEDAAGRIWVGSDQGLSMIDGDLVRQFTTQDGLPINEINAIYIAPDDTGWVGTNGGGLVRFNPPTPGSPQKPRFTAFGRDVNVPDAVAAIEPDGKGKLWIGATDGLFLFDPAQAGMRDPIVLKVDKQAGLIANEVNAFATDAQGGLWIATAGGATRYDGALAQDAPAPPPVTIESLRIPGRFWRAPFTQIVEGQKVDGWLGDESLKLPPRLTSFRVDFRGLSFRETSRLRYQVRLEGFDSDWSEPTAESFKEYTNLDPKSYTFSVRASTRPNAWGEPTRIAFEIEPAWWQTKTFLAGAVAGFALLLFVGYRARLYQMRRRNQQLAEAVDERTDDLRRYARALEEHSRALDRANARIREADRVKSEFLANMSHELRTPLNSIIGFSDVLVPSLEPKIGGREFRFLSNIQTSGRYLLLLINNLLDLSKIEAGRAEVFPEKTNIGDFVASTCEIVQGYSRDRDIEVVARIPDNLPEVTVDIPKFKQILLNLLSNAVKFSKSGDVVEVAVTTISAAESPIRVDSFELAVSDQGPGIRDEDRELIFEEFRQVGGGAAHPGGTGLGLALVRRFVLLMGGRIDLASTPGSGSTFRVTLPIAVRESTEHARHLVSRDGIQPRIVLIGLERAHFASLPAALENEGFAPVRGADLDAAARVAREVDPVAAIVSVGLNPSDGWSLFASLLDEYSLKDLTLGVCVIAEGKIAVAVGLDHLETLPVKAEDLAREVASLTGLGVADRGPVLIVDDDAGRARALERALSVYGLSARFAYSAAEALDLAVAEEPSALVVNLVMKGCVGLDAIRRLQHERRTRHTPVIALVSDQGPGGEACAEMARASGSEEQASFAELALTMHELLRRRSARAVRIAAQSLSYPNNG